MLIVRARSPPLRAGPNNSFKPNLLRYTKAMAEKACHGFGSTTQVGLTQALGAMKSILTAVSLLLCASCVSAHELTDSFPRDTQVTVEAESVTVEYCPDNTCDVFAIDDPTGSEVLQDFAYAYLLGASPYIYLQQFQADADSTATRSVLGRYSAHCPQEPLVQSARCVVMYLIDKHPIRVSFVRYDEGERNVVPIAPEEFWHGT